MKYVQCPRCRARFHTGVIYESVDICRRCGAPLLAGARLRGQLREMLTRRAARESLDWEAITGSQYIRRHVVPKDTGQGGSTPSPS